MYDKDVIQAYFDLLLTNFSAYSNHSDLVARKNSVKYFRKDFESRSRILDAKSTAASGGHPCEGKKTFARSSHASGPRAFVIVCSKVAISCTIFKEAICQNK